MKKKNIKNTKVLIFPAGSEIALEIYDSLRWEKNIEVFGGTTVPDFSSVAYPKKKLFHIPHVASERFVKDMLDLCVEQDIDIIFPAHDEAIKILSEHRKVFEKQSIKLVIHPKNTSRVCRSKLETYEALRGENFLPKYQMYDVDGPPKFKAPYFLKPVVGQGSKGVIKVNSFDEARELRLNNYILCELLPGTEYTIDCFTDSRGELIFCEGRVREQTTNGISVATTRVVKPAFKRIAKAIQSKIIMNGAWFFQVKESKSGQLKLLEVGARISGSSSYFRFCGINLTLMNIYNIKGYPLTVLPLEMRVTVKKRIKPFVNFSYDFENVYIDLDDTIIVNNELNLKVISFIFWCINKKKKLFLITRHKLKLDKTLEKYKLSQLFNELIHLTEGESKCLYIKSKKSIFIDDSHAERQSVSKKHKIPVYSTQCLPELY